MMERRKESETCGSGVEGNRRRADALSEVFDDFNEASDSVLACYFICVVVEVPWRNLHDLITA